MLEVRHHLHTSSLSLSLSLSVDDKQTMWSDTMRKEKYSGHDTVAGLEFTGVTQVVGIKRWKRSDTIASPPMME